VLSERAVRVLRWMAVPVVAAAAVFGGLMLASMLADVTNVESIGWAVFACSAGAAIYLAAWVAPSPSRWPILVLANVGLAFAFWLGIREDALGITLALGAAVVVGAYLSLRGLRTRPPPLVRTASTKALRYKGTAPFQTSTVDRSTFFGRDREARSLLSLVLAERLVVLFGKSGMGKSSLINAGLVEPLADRGYFPMTVRLNDRARGPVGGLIDGVRAAAREGGVDIVGGDESDLWRFFSTAEFWSPGNDLRQPILILDQFEELFTLHAPEPRRDFIRQLAELVRGHGAAGRTVAPAAASIGAATIEAGLPRLKIVLALREDYLADLEELAREIPGILQHRFRLGALTPDNAREAIVRPALLADDAFETTPFGYREDALQQILGFLARRKQGDATVSGDEVEPAQLQLVCQHVEELVRSTLKPRAGEARIEVSQADLGGEGQLQRVLQDFYDRTLAGIVSPPQRRRVRKLCEQFLISSAGRRLTEAEEEIVERRGVSLATLRQLVDWRLLRPEPRLGGVFYELSHDTLVEPILRTRRKRRRVARVRAGVALAVAVIAPSLWWVLGGQQLQDKNRARDAQALLAVGLKSRDDPGVFEQLLEARLTAIRERLGDGMGTREGYGALMFAAEELGLRFPELRDTVHVLRDDITAAFVREFGARPPKTEEDTTLNRRIPIAAGTFEMGSPDSVGEDDERPQHTVTVSPFLMQEHEVTNREYRRFDPSHGRGEPDDFPVVDVSWFKAVAYAAWLGGSLPTEAQWEFAARGEAGRTYPWGNEPEPDNACQRANWSGCSEVGLKSVKAGRDSGRTLERVYDLAGNAWEWSRDWYDPYDSAAAKDPLGPSTGTSRVLRGGSFYNVAQLLRGAFRSKSRPEDGLDLIGFRVVWSVAGGL